jgi:sodium/potassium-transporting ATPase subunit alpha
MKIPALSQEEVFLHLLSSPQGLSTEEATRRRREYGSNEIKEAAGPSVFAKLSAHFTHFLALLLWFAAALCFISEYLHPGEGLLRLGIAIVAVILINAGFTFVQEYRTEKAIEELRKMLPHKVGVVRDGADQEIDAADVVPGDLILLREGDKVPADARLVQANRLTVNKALLTGESEPGLLNDNSCPEDQEPANLVFAGTLIVGGSGKAVVFATGMATEFGKIARITGRVVEEANPLQVEITRVTRTISIIAAGAGSVFFLIGMLAGRGFWANFLFAIGIIIANVPEGLLPTVTLSLAMASRRMARRNALVKSLNAVEALGSVDVICTDKTGTLTLNRMTVRDFWSPGEETMACTVARLCNNVSETPEGIKGDPTETALYQYGVDCGGKVGERLAENPFDPERKRMATLHRIEGRLFVLIKGAGEAVLPLCSTVRKEGRHVAVDPATLLELKEKEQALAAQGLRVMALAFRELAQLPAGALPEDDAVFAGFMGLIDPVRPEVPEALQSCRSAGIRVIMLTGDSAPTAKAIARQIGLVEGEPVVIEGKQCATMPDETLRRALQQEELIFARMSPQNKMHVVSLLMEGGHRVAVTGDGVNDAPALKKAHVGVAMGLQGTGVAREAADIVLLDDNFASIVHAIEEGRAVFQNIRNFITYIFASNIPEAVPFLCYVLFGIPLPLTIMQILAVDLGTDMVPALALGSERPSPDIMQRPPRAENEHLLNKEVLLRSYCFLGVLEAAAGMSAYLYVMYRGGWRWPEPQAPTTELYLQATTACLAGIIVTQIANAFTCRSPVVPVSRLGFLSNRLLLAGIAFELLLAMLIIYTPFGNALFACASIPLDVWLLMIPFAILLFLLDEGRKHLRRRRPLSS